MSAKYILLWFQKHGIVVSLIALCLLIVICTSIMFSSRSNETLVATKELELLSQNIRKYYQNRPDYWGLNSQTVIDKQIAQESIIRNNELIGALKNKILVGNGLNADILMPGARGFDIIYKDLSQNNCIALASANFSKHFWLGITAVSIVQNNRAETFSWNDNTNKLPITKTMAKKYCHNNSNIIWHFE